LNTSKNKNRNLPTGVYKTLNNKFISRIRINKKQHNLGTFKTIEEASNAYQNALKQLEY
jgi:hypothetical protein